MTSIQAHQLELVGGRLCLDFVNTAAWDGDERVVDHLAGYDDLVLWGHHAGILSAERAARVRGPMERADASEAMAIALALRRACRRLLAPSGGAGAADAALLEGVLRKFAPSLRLALGGGGLAHAGPDRPGAWLALPVALSTIELATSDARRAIRACPGERCGWLFLDRTRNRRRVWCSMLTCGNRAKARAHYARKRQAAG